MKYGLLLFLPVIIGITSCNNEKASDNISESRMLVEQDLNEVQAIRLKMQPFQKEIISNGKLAALQKSTLAFGVGERIVQKHFKNGDFVQKGTVIASLSKTDLKSQLKQAQFRLEKARLDLEDVLIGQGYDLSDTASIPDELFKTAKLLSGYTSALNDHENTMLALQKTDLLAPFSGVLSGIKHNVHDRIGASEIYCTLIDQSKFLVGFDVLETEIMDIKTGKKVEIAPFSSQKYQITGVVYEIDPVVDEHGLIRVNALIESTRGLMEGMNMKVRVRTMVPDKLVVPKSAVLIRQNKDVLFKYSNGKAIWTYVIKELENSTSYAVKLQPNSIGSLTESDTIIVSGNLNLAHESEVIITQ
jgi:membrane fusion protein, multidrug efflux system